VHIPSSSLMELLVGVWAVAVLLVQLAAGVASLLDRYAYRARTSVDVESVASALPNAEVRHKQGFPVRLSNPGTVPTSDVQYIRKYTWQDHLPQVWLPQKCAADPS